METYKKYQTARDKVMTGYYYIGVGMLILMTVLVTAAVLLRYIFELSFNWLTEINIILFAFTTFWGIAVAIWKNEHVVIDMLYNTFSPKLKKIMAVVNNVLVFIVLAFMMYATMDYMVVAGRQISPAIFIGGEHMSMKYIYAIMPITIGFSMIVTLDRIVDNFIRPIESFETIKEETEEEVK